MFACGKQAGLSRLPLNRSASVSVEGMAFRFLFPLFVAGIGCLQSNK